MKLNHILLVSLAIVGSCFSMMSSAGAKNGIEFSVGASLSEFDGGGLYDSGDGAIFQLGYRLLNNFSAEIMYTDLTHEFDSAVGEVDVNHTMINGLYHFNRGDHFEPYISFGAGQFETDTEDGTVLNAGTGFKYYFNQFVFLRPELRFNSLTGDLDDSFLDANLMISVLFGGGKETVKLSDKDKDGVADLKDKCPNTLMGSRVDLHGCQLVGDADKDGVADNRDKCPSTKAGVRVNQWGCPLDSDGDGVPDSKDHCANTAKKLKVDKHGCPVKLTKSVSIKLEIRFDSNKAIVKDTHYAEIRKVSEFLQKYEGSSVVIEGYTDSLGNADYNRKLSQKRADAVANVLVESLGIDSRRVSAVGYGEANPIADNATKAGRDLNRRVIGFVKAKTK